MPCLDHCPGDEKEEEVYCPWKKGSPAGTAVRGPMRVGVPTIKYGTWLIAATLGGAVCRGNCPGVGLKLTERPSNSMGGSAGSARSSDIHWEIVEDKAAGPNDGGR